MAERYGGKFSPEPRAGGTPGGATGGTPPLAPALQGTRPMRAGLRANLLFFLPLAIIIRAFTLPVSSLVPTLTGGVLIVLAAWLTREGEAAHDAWEARKVARRPAIPRKIFGSVLVGAGLFLASVSGDAGAPGAALLGVLGAALHLFAFGPDPLRDKGMEGIDGYQQDRASRAVDAAEATLAQMADAITRARDRKLSDRVAQFQTAARQMFRRVEEDPRDLTAARKYLTVYLTGARDATVKFADLYAQTRSDSARADYVALLDDLEEGFAGQTHAFLDNNRTDLDIEIDVLRERLQREGVGPG